jgi:hypothetical protein
MIFIALWVSTNQVMGLWALKKTKLQKVGTIRTEILTPIYTAERRAKMSEAKMGKKRSAERRAKMSEAMKGKKRSADHKVRPFNCSSGLVHGGRLPPSMRTSLDDGSVRGLGAVSRSMLH